MSHDNGYASYGYSQPYAYQDTTNPTSNSDQSYYGSPQYAQYHQDAAYQQGQQTLGAFHVPSGSQQNSWGASPISSMASQPYGFDTSQQSGAYPSLSSQGTPAQCTCGFYNGHHTTSCPQYHSAQGNNGSPTAFGYSTVDTQPYVGYTQQTNMSTYNTHNIGVPGYLSPSYGSTTSNSTTPAQASPPRPSTPQKPDHGRPHHTSGLAAAWTGTVASIGALGTGIGQLFKID